MQVNRYSQGDAKRGHIGHYIISQWQDRGINAMITKPPMSYTAQAVHIIFNYLINTIVHATTFIVVDVKDKKKGKDNYFLSLIPCYDGHVQPSASAVINIKDIIGNISALKYPDHWSDLEIFFR